MPTGIIAAVAGVFVLVVIASSLDWLLSNPLILVVILAAVSAGVFLWQKQKRARNRV